VYTHTHTLQEAVALAELEDRMKSSHRLLTLKEQKMKDLQASLHSEVVGGGGQEGGGWEGERRSGRWLSYWGYHVCMRCVLCVYVLVCRVGGREEIIRCVLTGYGSSGSYLLSDQSQKQIPETGLVILLCQRL